MRLTRTQADAMTAVIALRDSRASAEEVTARAAEALRGVLGWDGYRIFSVDPATLLLGRLLGASDGDGRQRRRWLQHGYQAEEHVPFGSFGMETRMRLGVRAITFNERLDRSFGMPADIRTTFEERGYRERHHSHIVEYHPGVRIDGNLLMNFADGGRWVATMQAYRISGQAPFRSSDVAFAHAIAPRIGEAIGEALRREQLQVDAGSAVPEASGIVILDRAAEVQYASPAGREWLAALGQHPLEAETGLPTAVWAAISGLRSGREGASGQVVLPGTTALIEATPGGTDGSVALVVSAVRSADTASTPAAWGLSAAESRVTRLVIQGASNREVADQLSISENTVEWHLRRVFDKVGVRSRSQLMAMNLSDGDGARTDDERIA